ncbi:MAG TPA: STAS domain-containing protein [Anaerohalosphaeraceae bacterium]|jgi:anti-anti-sigma factor|nr:STAS domain-containing protein [Anaerohalosphaeraceae bacterium]HRT49876.1 STAS domain-containing protein [Anaerohalosphaeraceae bacterium]HRT86768.1 STAS domain-containing protein [Anaerohalosphaeraceae bacterium]
MGIQNWSDNIILVNLAQEPQLGEELLTVIQMVKERPDNDVVIDFADVDIITSSSIAKLLKLRKALADNNHRLVLSSVSRNTYGVFTVTGLDSVFEFVEDQFLALAGLQLVG